MRKCGLKTIPIGSHTANYGDVTTAIKSVVSEQDPEVAAAKSYAKLKANIPFKAWRKWFLSMVNKPDVGALTVNDILGLKEGGLKPAESTVKDANRLLKLLNPSKKVKLSKEAKRRIAATKRNIKQSKGLTAKQIKDVIARVQSVLTVDGKVQRGESLRKNSKRRENAKLDVSKEKLMMISSINQIEPSLIPVEHLDEYLNVMEQLGSNKKTPSYSPTLFKDMQSVLDKLSQYVKAPKLETGKTQNTNETNKLKTAYVEQITSTKSQPSLGRTRLRRDMIRDINNITKEEWMQLTPQQLETALRSKHNLENVGIGYGESMFDVLQTVRKNRTKSNLSKALGKVKKNFIVHGITDLGDKLTAAFTKGKTSADIAVRGLSTRMIDNSLGIKGREIFENTFEKIASAYSSMETDVNESIANVNNGEKLISKGRFKSNTVIKQKALIMLSMLQEQRNANPGVAGALDPVAVLKKSIEYGKIPGRAINPETSRLYQEILDEYAPGGKLDLEKVNEALSKEDIQAKNALRAEIEKASEYFDFTNKVQQGGNAYTYNLFMPYNLVSEPDTDGNLGQSFGEFYSTKSGSLTERDGEVRPMVLDPFAATRKMTSGIYKDYHMTPVVTEVVNSVAELNEEMAGNENIAAIYNVLDYMLKNIFSAHSKKDSWWDRTIQKAEKWTGAALISSGRKFIGETVGHIGYAINNPMFFSKALSSQQLRAFGYENISIVRNLGSLHTQKLYDSDSAHGAHMNKQVEGFELDGDNQARTTFHNNVSVIQNFIRKNDYLKRGTKKFDDFVIAGADKKFSRLIFFQAVEDKFKELTKKNIDWDKVKINDEAYMAEYKDFLKEARKFADNEVTMSSNSSNPFLAVPKHQRAKGDRAALRKAIQSFMQSFTFGEWATTKQAIENLILGGEIGRVRAAGILAGVHVRMALYSTVLSVLYSAMFPDPDDEDEEVWDIFKRYLYGSVLSNFLGRKMGTVGRLAINFAIERINENFLEFLRNGEEYNSYKHGIAFSPYNLEFFKRWTNGGYDILGKGIGQLQVPVQIIDKIVKDIRTATTSKSVIKREEAIARLKYRLPFYYLVITRRIPYKDMNQLMNHLERKGITLEEYINQHLE